MRKRARTHTRKHTSACGKVHKHIQRARKKNYQRQRIMKIKYSNGKPIPMETMCICMQAYTHEISEK